MMRLILIIVLVLVAIPFFNKAKDYTSNKLKEAKVATDGFSKAFKYKNNEKK
jgi:competence protein ComGC